MQKLRDRTAALEGRMSTIEDDVAPLKHEVRQVQNLTSTHAACLEDMENRLRRNNVLAVGIPERAEGKNPVAFIERWLNETFGKEAFSHLFAVERAHCVPARPPHPGEPPRLFLFKFLNFKDRDAALYLARTKGEAMKMDNVLQNYKENGKSLQS